MSNNNPFSESQFKTLKYRPGFPERFFTLEEARSFCRKFFRWYNQEHRHAGIAMMTPDMMHSGQAAAVHTARQQVLNLAYAAHPERFVQRPPAPSPLPTAVYINPPKPAPAVTQEVLQ